MRKINPESRKIRSTSNSTGGSLPSQTGNSGKFLTTDGSNASWASIAKSYAAVYQDINNTALRTLSTTAGAYVVATTGTGALAIAGLNSGDFTIGTSGSNTGRLTYTGTTTKTFSVICTFTYTSSSSTPTYYFGIGKSSTTAVQASAYIEIKGITTNSVTVTISDIMSLTQNDYLVLLASNDGTTGPSVRIRGYNLSVAEI